MHTHTSYKLQVGIKARVVQSYYRNANTQVGSEYELPESSERSGILVHTPFCVILHSYTNPVFLTAEMLRVPLGAPTIRLREKRKDTLVTDNNKKHIHK